MDSKEFWRLIEVAREQSGGDEECHATLLVTALVALGASAIIAFGAICKRYVALVIERADIENTELVNEIRGEHYLTAFAYRLVGQGESEFYRGLAANDAHDDEQVRVIGYWDTPLEVVVPTAYYECTGHDHPDWVGFSEYLAAGSSSAETAPVSFDEPDLHDWGRPLHDLRRSLPSEFDSLCDDVRLLLIKIADLYHRLPVWKQKTKAGILLAQAGNLTSEFHTSLEGVLDDLDDSLQRLIPDEQTCTPEGAATA